MVLKESVYQKKTIKWLESKGLYCIKQNASGLSRAGTPDYIINLNGLFFAIEFKKSIYDKPTPLQSYNINKINNTMGIAIVLRPEKDSVFKQTMLLFFDNKIKLESLKENLISIVGIE